MMKRRRRDDRLAQRGPRRANGLVGLGKPVFWLMQEDKRPIARQINVFRDGNYEAVEESS